jgi:DNA-binding transcriptional regulator YdaS (Cro superfamily)
VQEEESPQAKINKLNELVESLCGIYSRVARRLGVHRTFVSRVARGERHSVPVESELAAEYDRAKDL